VPWRYYYQDGVFLAQFEAWNRSDIQSHVWNISNLFTILSSSDADTQLPEVVFIENGANTDEHPSEDIQPGANYVKSILDALMKSSAWQDSVFILAYDEGGGLYDHVPPFQVTPPDDIVPNCPGSTPGRFDLSGFRVPMVVVSPYSKPHYVSHTNMETTSILKFVETRFNLPPLTRRDAAAPDMTEFLDMSTPHWLKPPALPVQPNECVNNRARCDKSLENYPNLP
jgi:phospholipase C